MLFKKVFLITKKIGLGLNWNCWIDNQKVPVPPSTQGVGGLGSAKKFRL